MVVSGTNATLRGTMSDETGSIVAAVVHGDGTTNTVAGLVERNGDFWIENVPLNGINHISVQATDAAGNVTTTNFTVNVSSMTLTIDTVPTGDDLWKPTGNVSGRISDPTASVFVNGVQGTNNGNGTWSAYKVPIYGTGTATFNVSTTPATLQSSFTPQAQTPAAQALYTVERAPTVIVSHHEADQIVHQITMTSPTELDPSSLIFNDQTITYNASLFVDANNNWQNNYQGQDDVRFQPSPTFPTTPYSIIWSPISITRPHNHVIPNIPFDDAIKIVPGPALVKAVHYFARSAGFWFDRPVPGTNSFTRFVVGLSAGTTLKLYTGGKATIGSRNLLSLRVVNAQSYQASSKDALFGIPWWNSTITPIIMNYLQLGNRRPGADGIVWRTLPDNATEDVTVVAIGFLHYSANVVPTKYKVNINLTTSTTNVNLETDIPEVCVGQKVTFALTNLPMSQIVNMVGQWTLPQKYVNHQWQHSTPGVPNGIPPISYGSVNYDIDASLLRNTNQTACWFVNGSGGRASVGMNLLFNNGQSLTVAAKGNFTIYRPAIHLWQPLWDGIPRIIIDSGYLTLGNAGESGTNADMSFAHYIDTHYSGTAGYTQIISGEYDGNLSFSTDGFELDNLEWPRGLNPIANSQFGNQVPFDDGPKISLPTINNIAAMNLSFQTYLRFKPDDGNSSGNIFITLRAVTWGLSCSASYSGGVWNKDPGGATSGPFDADSDAFPLWTKVFSNIGNPAQ